VVVTASEPDRLLLSPASALRPPRGAPAGASKPPLANVTPEATGERPDDLTSSFAPCIFTISKGSSSMEGSSSMVGTGPFPTIGAGFGTLSGFAQHL